MSRRPCSISSMTRISLRLYRLSHAKFNMQYILILSDPFFICYRLQRNVFTLTAGDVANRCATMSPSVTSLIRLLPVMTVILVSTEALTLSGKAGSHARYPAPWSPTDCSHEQGSVSFDFQFATAVYGSGQQQSGVALLWYSSISCALIFISIRETERDIDSRAELYNIYS